MALEIIERQAQQAIENMQVQLGVQPRADDRGNQPASVSEERLVSQQQITINADISAKVEMLWNWSTLLTVVITNSGGKIERTLMAREASLDVA